MGRSTAQAPTTGHCWARAHLDDLARLIRLHCYAFPSPGRHAATGRVLCYLAVHPMGDRELGTLLRRGAAGGDVDTAATCRALLPWWEGATRAAYAERGRRLASLPGWPAWREPWAGQAR